MSLFRVFLIVAAVVAAAECFHVTGYQSHPHRDHHEAPRGGNGRRLHTKRQTNENQQKNLVVHVDGRKTEQFTASVADDGTVSLVQVQDCPSCKYMIMFLDTALF
jgi:hypothetical protein